MAHKFSLIFLGGSGSTIKQIHYSRQKFFGLITLFIVATVALGYGVIDYVSLRRSLSDKSSIERDLGLQTEEVVHQREQIQKFAIEINELKNNLLRLNQFEERIRIIANINQPDNHDGLFGVGGSAPEDLNPDIELSQRHQRLIKDMHRQVGQLDQATANQQDDFESLLGKLEAQKNLLAHTPAIRPVRGWQTSGFGYRHSPFTGKKEFHKGLDIANRKGTNIVATADGVLSFVGSKGNLGKVVVIDHGHGIVTRYAHLDKVVQQRGARVKRGEVIAQMGNSGRSTGPHLHYEVRLNGVPVNPTKYILN